LIKKSCFLVIGIALLVPISLYLVTSARYNLPPFSGVIDRYDPRTEEHNWRSAYDPDHALRRWFRKVQVLPKEIPPN